MLSIGIPTYNREKRLNELLGIITSQNLEFISEIIIVDNNSNYDILKLVKKYKTEKIRIIKNSFNVRMSVNMMNPFLHCRSKWLWLLSDDDYPTENALQTILELISLNPNAGMLKFSMDSKLRNDDHFVASTLEAFIDVHYNDKKFKRGDLVFISNGVYNLDILKPYLGYGFEYSYTYIPYLIPVILGLNDRKISVCLVNRNIVKYGSPDDGGWPVATVGKGLSNISHLPLNLDKKYRKKFLNIMMTITYPFLLRNLFVHYTKHSYNDFAIIYNNIYRYYLPCYHKLLARTISCFLKSVYIISFIKKIKKK